MRTILIVFFCLTAFLTQSCKHKTNKDASASSSNETTVEKAESDDYITEQIDDNQIEDKKKESDRAELKRNYQKKIDTDLDYTVLGLGGISNGVLTVTNNTGHYLNSITAYVTAYKESGQKYSGENFEINNIGDGESKDIRFSFNRGTKCEAEILGFYCRELGLRFSPVEPTWQYE